MATKKAQAKKQKAKGVKKQVQKATKGVEIDLTVDPFLTPEHSPSSQPPQDPPHQALPPPQVALLSPPQAPDPQEPLPPPQVAPGQLLHAERGFMEAPLNVEVLAGARIAGHVEALIGTSTAPIISGRLAAALSGDVLAVASSLAEQSAVRAAVGGLADHERRLLAAFRSGGLGPLSPEVAGTVHALLVPLAAAVLAAEAARFGAPLPAASVCLVAADPRAFARNRELAAAVRALGPMSGGDALLPAPPRPARGKRAPPPPPAVCFVCHKTGHKAKVCPEAKK